MLPIVTRELRVAAKRKVTYRLRWIVGLLGGAGVIVASTFAGGYTTEAGHFVFWIASVVMLLICAAAGLLLTADSISREKRDGTLGLLFLTRLTSMDIVLGKLTVGALTGGAVAFAGVPFLAFSLCLGGVTAEEFWSMSGALLFVVAYSLIAGIFVSSLLRKEAAIVFAFCALIAGPMALTPLAVMKYGAIPLWLARLNPFFASLSLMDRYEIYFPRDLGWQSVKFQFLALIAMLLVSFVALPWTICSETARRKLFRISSHRFLQNKSISENNPVYCFNRRRGHPLAILLVCVGLYFVVGFSAPTAWEGQVTFVLLMAILPKLFVLWQASGAMALERQSGFLETLLTTPVSGGEVLRAKMSAIKAQIAPALIFALIGLWATSTKWWGASGEITVGATLVFAAMITLVVDVHAIGWIGLWQGLLARDRRRALVWAIIFGLIGPWIPGALAFAFLDWLLDEPMWIKNLENTLPVGIVSANVISFAIACFAMARLHEKFRATATSTWASLHAGK